MKREIGESLRVGSAVEDERSRNGIWNIQVLADVLRHGLDPHHGLVPADELGTVLADPTEKTSRAPDDKRMPVAEPADEGVVDETLEIEQQSAEPEKRLRRTEAVSPGGTDLVRGRTSRDGRAAEALRPLDEIAVPALRFIVDRHVSADVSRTIGPLRRMPTLTSATVPLQPLMIGDEILRPLEFRRSGGEPPVPDKDPSLVQHPRERAFLFRKQTRVITDALHDQSPYATLRTERDGPTQDRRQTLRPTCICGIGDASPMPMTLRPRFRAQARGTAPAAISSPPQGHDLPGPSRS